MQEVAQMAQVIPPQWDAASVVVVIGAIGTMLLSVIGSISAAVLAWNANKTSQANGLKTDHVIQQAAEIHTLANSNLSKSEAALALAQEKNKGLEQLLHQVEKSAILAAENAAKLAIANMSMPRETPGSGESPSSLKADKIIKKIEENTAETAHNTAPIADVILRPKT